MRNFALIMNSHPFIICKASAGSGKTHTLVRQYLQLAFSANEKELPQRFASILAITFTNKAANEMKERILLELDNIASRGTGCNMGNDLAELMGMNDGTLRHYAEVVRKAILHNYSDFAVCTIDSFVHRLARTFAHDLGLPMNFEVQIDEEDLINHTVDNLMMLVGSDGEDDLTSILCDFAETSMDDGRSFSTDQVLKELAKVLFEEDSPEHLMALKEISLAEFAEIRKTLKQQRNALKDEIQRQGIEAMEIIQENGLQTSDFPNRSKGAGAYFEKVADRKPANITKSVTEYTEGIKLGASKTPQHLLTALEAIRPTLQAKLAEVARLTAQANTRTVLIKNLHGMALLNKMNELMSAYQQENEIVHLSEFNKQISNVVQEQPTPFIYERIGNRYRNYLIDEFQDTSRLQWHNLVPLIENGVSAGHTSLVVGDGKQAIYRFRQGDVDQFVALPHVDNPIHGRLLEYDETSVVNRLESNYRTAKDIVEFNNEFFEWAIRNHFSDNQQLKDIYLGKAQEGEEEADLVQIPKKNAAGYVQVAFDKAENEPDWMASKVYDDIKQLTEEKGYSYKDITILARYKTKLGEISTYLTERGVPVVSSESFLLSQSKVVMLVKNVFQYLLDHTDRIAAERVLLFLYNLGKVKSLHKEAFLSTNKGIDLDKILAEEGLTFNTEKLLHLGLYDCCEEILRMLQLDGIETSYQATLLNVTAKYCSRHRHDLGEFAEWLESKLAKLSTSTADDLDAVRLMTIHTAKGLESPVVMLCLKTPKTKTDSIWVDIDPQENIKLPTSLVQDVKKDGPTIFDPEHLAENQKKDMDEFNILYVALTRPKEKLMIYCPSLPEKPSTETKKQPALLLWNFLNQSTKATQLEDKVFCIGSNADKVADTKSASGKETVTMSGVSFPTWGNRITIADQTSDLLGGADNEHVRLGNLMHDILSKIHTLNDTEAALKQHFAHQQITEDEMAKISASLSKMLSQGDVTRFFDPQYESKNECSMVWNGEVLRPDRIVIADNETWVVDFKTGAPKAEHHAQVSHYCDAIKAMGYNNVKGYLLYIGTESCQVKAVD